MTDNYAKAFFKVDDGVCPGFFTCSGAITPRRPVYITGATSLKISQAVNNVYKYIGVASESGAEGDVIAVHMQGIVKVYITGSETVVGIAVVATGTGAGAAFRGTGITHATSGAVSIDVEAEGKIAGYALQDSTDGDLSLVRLV